MEASGSDGIRFYGPMARDECLRAAAHASASVPAPPKGVEDVIQKQVVDGLSASPEFRKLLELEVKAYFLGRGRVADAHSLRKGVTYLLADLPNLVKKASGGSAKVGASLDSEGLVEFYNEEHIAEGPNGGQFAPSSGVGSTVAPAGWQPDPTGRHTHRYWDGAKWTENVGDNGVSGIDADMSPKAPTIPPPPGPAPAASVAAPVVPPAPEKKKGFFSRLADKGAANVAAKKGIAPPAAEETRAQFLERVKAAGPGGLSVGTSRARNDSGSNTPVASAPSAPANMSRQERKLEEEKQGLLKDLDTYSRRGSKSIFTESAHGIEKNQKRADAVAARVAAIQQEQVLAALRNK